MQAFVLRNSPGRMLSSLLYLCTSYDIFNVSNLVERPSFVAPSLRNFSFRVLSFRSYSDHSTLTMPSIIQSAFFVEALVNIPAIVSLLFWPESTLCLVLATKPSYSAAELNRTATFLARCAGVLILALTPQLLLALPDSKDCVGKRKQVYWTLGLGEAGLIPLFLWEAFRASDRDKLEWQGGLTRKAALLCAGMLIPPLAWRVFVFGWKEHWFGPEGGRGREKRTPVDKVDADDLVRRWSLGRKEQ